MQQPGLFSILPDYVCTPDGMAIDKEGNLILSCPNFAQDEAKGCVLKIDKSGNIKKWFDVPVDPDTKIARNMGITFDDDYNMYICDNQGWAGNPGTKFKGRVIKITADENGIVDFAVIAKDMEHPNGLRYRDGNLYVTQSTMEKVSVPSGKMVSAVYKFSINDRNVSVTNTLDDPHIFTTFETQNAEVQYGADGIVFGKDGNLYVGNFGDGAVHKITFAPDGSAAENTVFAKDSSQLQSTDGMDCDEKGNIYVADFSANAVAVVYPEGKIERIAQSPDCDGLDGGLDQPGEPIVWNGQLVVSCFDLVTGPDKVNTGHEMPATLSKLELV